MKVQGLNNYHFHNLEVDMNSIINHILHLNFELYNISD